MSYSQTYNGSVHYSGSATYHYGPSEHGGSGTVSYSGNVPVSICITVDTNPFDRSVVNCSNSVQTLNGAVVAMNASQVASIQNSAENVSRHVISGFFNMIGSELSQNMAALLAKFKAVFELMTTKSATLEKQQIVMQDDYTRISERYNKIFQDLDEELEKRVVALDKNVFAISKRVQGEQLYSETAKKVSYFLLGVNEEEMIQQQLLVANTKAKVLSAMEKLSENVVQSNTYSKKVNDIVTDVDCTSAINSYIPVIYTESSSLDSGMTDCRCFANPYAKGVTDQICASVKNYFVTDGKAALKRDAAESKKIDEAFSLIAEREFQGLNDEKSARVYDVLTKLKESNV